MTTQQFDPDAFEPIHGCSLVTYAAVCRDLVRVPAGTERQLAEALSAHSLTPSAWAVIQSGWSARIAGDPFVRDAFRRLYLREGDLA